MAVDSGIRPLRLLLAGMAAAFLLLILNAAVSPLLFPDGPPVGYQGLRETQLVLFHMLGLLATAYLIALGYPLGYRGGAHRAEGLRCGALLGLLASVPMNLHVFAMVEQGVWSAVLPVLWTVATWSACGLVVALVYAAPYGKGPLKRNRPSPIEEGFQCTASPRATTTPSATEGPRLPLRNEGNRDPAQGVRSPLGEGRSGCRLRNRTAPQGVRGSLSDGRSGHQRGDAERRSSAEPRRTSSTSWGGTSWWC